MSLASLISGASSAYGVPPSILSNLVAVESGGNPYAVSGAGAIGYTQLMPNTAASLGVNPWDPAANVYGGANYLSQLYGQYGSWPAALSAYNTGSPNSALGLQYAADVMGYPQATVQPSPVSPTSVTTTGTAATGSTKAAPSNSVWVYGLAAVLIIGLFAFGIWGVVKE